MNTDPFSKAAWLIHRIENMPPEERNSISEENIRSTEAEYKDFLSAFGIGNCYICGNPLSSFSKKTPCIHWLLKPKGFKKNDLPEIAKRFGFFQIQTFLRWVANTQGFAKHINDLPEEGSGMKVIELTIRYRNLEWSFSCAESDYLGHQTSQHAKHPHYHFQMRIDRRAFISYNDFHVPFMERDILSMETKRRLPHIVKHKFPFGEGMAEVLNDDTVEALIENSTGGDADEDASLHFDTIAMADEGTTIRGEDLYEIIQEAKAKGVSVASLIHKLPNARTRVLVTPGPGVVEQALRTGRKKDA
ncbi:MAG: hypothetical protein PHR30_07365 [Gallionellaceae bacterium]|nr:hypothetical protein [Gallionellaceae bacterium]